MVDLHVHSNLSANGEYSIEKLLAKAEHDGINVLSITDHNTAISSLMMDNIDVSKYYKGNLITGIEIDTCYKGITFEVMAYGFNPYKVQEWAYSKFGNVEYRQRLIMKKLKAKCDEMGYMYDPDFPWNGQEEYAHQNIYRNIMQYKENATLFNYDIKDDADFYRNSTGNPDFNLYINMSFLWPSIKEVVDVIHSAHGKVFLARPYTYRQDIDVDTLLKICKKRKVDGVEVFIPTHTQNHIDRLLAYCNKNVMLVAGGSMFGEANYKTLGVSEDAEKQILKTIDILNKHCYQKTFHKQGSI